MRSGERSCRVIEGPGKDGMPGREWPAGPQAGGPTESFADDVVIMACRFIQRPEGEQS